MMERMTFKSYRKQSLRIAKQLCFDEEIIYLIANAKENREIYHLMIEGRQNLSD